MTADVHEHRTHRWERTDWVITSAIAARTLYGMGMVALIPVLIATHPLLLELLSGSTVAEVVVGARVRLGEIPWVWAILAGVPLWVLTDWIYWWAGVRWGDRALQRLLSRGGEVRARKQAARVEQVIDRFGAWAVLFGKFLPVPGQLVYAAAGTAGMRLRVFLVLNLLGTLLSVTIVVSLGFALGQRAVDLVELFKRYAVLTGVVVAVLLVVVLLVRRRWSRADRAAA